MPASIALLVPGNYLQRGQPGPENLILPLLNLREPKRKNLSLNGKQDLNKLVRLVWLCQKKKDSSRSIKLRLHSADVKSFPQHTANKSLIRLFLGGRANNFFVFDASPGKAELTRGFTFY